MTELTPAERAAYPDSSIRDLTCVIRRARDTDSQSRHVCGRYTASRVADDAPDPLSDERTIIRVRACEREIVCEIPMDAVDEILTALTSGVQTQMQGE